MSQASEMSSQGGSKNPNCPALRGHGFQGSEPLTNIAMTMCKEQTLLIKATRAQQGSYVHGSYLHVMKFPQGISHRQNLRLGCQPPQAAKMQVSKPEPFHGQNGNERELITYVHLGYSEVTALQWLLCSCRDCHIFSTIYVVEDQGNSQ